MGHTSSHSLPEKLSRPAPPILAKAGNGLPLQGGGRVGRLRGGVPTGDYRDLSQVARRPIFPYGKNTRKRSDRNLLDPSKTLECTTLVDTGSAYLVLPMAWRPQLGDLGLIREVICETATQDTVKAPICGPVEIQIEGFQPVFGEVMFLDMHPVNGRYEPLLGYIVLEQSQAAVDMLEQRLVDVEKTDLK